MINIIINKFIRKSIFLYILLLSIYKKYSNLFFFVESKKYYFLKQKKFKNVIEIGSNNYQIFKLLKKLNNNLTIFCFDPFLENSKNNKNFYKIALGNFEGKKNFFMPYYKNINLDSLNSFKLTNIKNYQKKYLKNTKINIKTKKIKVNKLDNYNIKSDFIKIDTEGFELEILKGAINHIKKNSPVILLEKNDEFFEIKKFLKKLHYDAYKIFNESFIIDTNNFEEDIFFLKKNNKIHKNLIYKK